MGSRKKRKKANFSITTSRDHADKKILRQQHKREDEKICFCETTEGKGGLFSKRLC